MDLVDNVGKSVKVDTTQKKKKKRGGTKFSNTKARKRNAQRRKEASMSTVEERYGDEDLDRSDDEGSVSFRRHMKMRSINLESVVEIVEKVDVDETKDGQDIEVEEDYLHKSPSHCDSLGFDTILIDQCENVTKEVPSVSIIFPNSLYIVYYSLYFLSFLFVDYG